VSKGNSRDSLEGLKDLLSHAGVLDEVLEIEEEEANHPLDAMLDKLEEQEKKDKAFGDKQEEEKPKSVVRLPQKGQENEPLKPTPTKVDPNAPRPGGGKDKMPPSVLDLSDDLMEARISVDPGAIDNFDRDYVDRMLRFRGIRFGIIERNLEAVIESVQQGIPVVKELIARGQKAIQGQPAIVNFYFEKGQLLKISDGLEDEEDAVDHRSQHRVNTVREGMMLAEKIPPILGPYGINVKGEKIPAITGRDAPLYAGKNTELNENGELFATAGGRPAVDRKGNVSVQEIFFVQGDLGMDIGNINFQGDVHITGSVKSGFTINAVGNVFVKGYVESSKIEAGGDIHIRGGFTGGEKGHLKAGKNCMLSHCNGGLVEVMGDLEVRRELINCTVWVHGILTMKFLKSSIKGSTVYVKKELHAHNVGSVMAMPTRLFVGPQEFCREEIRELHAEIQEIRSRILFARKGIKTLQNKIDAGVEPVEKFEGMIERLKGSILRIERERLQALDQEQELMGIINSYTPCIIKIQGVVYPGVKMKIGRIAHGIDNKQTRIEFFEDPNEKTVGTRPVKIIKAE